MLSVAPLLEKRVATIWLMGELEMLIRVLSRLTWSVYFPGSIQPTRSSGAMVLEKEEHRITSPLAS
jgi:hypothetical protein